MKILGIELPLPCHYIKATPMRGLKDTAKRQQSALITEVSLFQGCPLGGVPLYIVIPLMLLLTHNHLKGSLHYGSFKHIRSVQVHSLPET